MGEMLSAFAHATPYSSPETWVALMDGSGAELSNVDYARQRINIPGGSDPTWSSLLVGTAGARVENATPVSFGIATVNWGLVGGAAIYDAASAGNELMRKVAPQQRSVLIGDPFRIPAGAIKVRLVRP